MSRAAGCCWDKCVQWGEVQPSRSSDDYPPVIANGTKGVPNMKKDVIKGMVNGDDKRKGHGQRTNHDHARHKDIPSRLNEHLYNAYVTDDDLF
ncbi:hypothetical protein O3M35_008712 [Rhynocoris fuscipes]|uniref:Uncharacterized protein n=1 Tax=Rhynocoris fuscipes TaxID=488301 RepID=A0AAW1DEL7_9HEMI